MNAPPLYTFILLGQTLRIASSLPLGEGGGGAIMCVNSRRIQLLPKLSINKDEPLFATYKEYTHILTGAGDINLL